MPMASSPRKRGGGGISICLTLLVFCATAGRYLPLLRLAEIPPSPLLEGRRRQQRTSVAVAKNLISGEKRLSGMEAIIDDDGNGGRDNEFLVHFDDIILSGDHRVSNHDASAGHHFAALVLREDRAGTTRVYCRRGQMKSLSRGKYFVQMLRRGLEQYPTRPMAHAIPILVKHDDSNGCYPATRCDKYGFPRLTWSIPAANVTIDTPPSPEHGDAPSSSSSTWCSAIGMPSYKIWKDVNQDNDGVSSMFRMNNINALYQWSEKIPKAVWRGSTTCNKGMYGLLPLWDIPRSRLVRSSLERPDLIDAGFHKLVGKYAGVASRNAARALLKEPIPLNDMMKYKAVIDIDGNNWSARFPSLLCANSIVIKISPDFVDQYAHELVPNVHYVPASLDNITQVVENIMDPRNDGEMRRVVKEANNWCRLHLSKESLAIKAMHALEMYRDALERYGVDAWESPILDDLVECDV